MKKAILSLSTLFLLQSCVVSTATKVVKTAGKIAIGTVKTSIHTIDWTVKKINGKISEDRLNGKWKIVGIYKGSFQDFESQKDHDNVYQGCSEGEELYEFKTKRNKFTHYLCGNLDPEIFKYSYSWEKDPLTGQKENMITYGSGYFNVIMVDNKHLVLEGYFIDVNGSRVRSVCFLDRTK